MIRRLKIWLLNRRMDHYARVLNDYIESSALDLSVSDTVYQRRIEAVRIKLRELRIELNRLGSDSTPARGIKWL